MINLDQLKQLHSQWRYREINHIVMIDTKELWKTFWAQM